MVAAERPITERASESSRIPTSETFYAEKYKMRIVERIIPDAPIIFTLPGWCGVTDATDPALPRFNELGYSVIQVGTPEPREERRKRLLFRATRQLQDDAEAFTELINEKTEEDENVSIIGCSYGGLTAIEVAAAIPSKVDHLMLINPAIRHPKDSLIALAARYTGNMGLTTVQSVWDIGIDGCIGLVRTAGEAAANPLDSFHRGMGIIHAQETTYKAYQLAKNGTRITIVTGNWDGIFHGDKTERTFREDFTEEYQKDTEDPSVIFDKSLHQLMPRFVPKDGGHDLGLAGAKFADFAVDEWRKTENYYADIELQAA